MSRLKLTPQRKLLLDQLDHGEFLYVDTWRGGVPRIKSLSGTRINQRAAQALFNSGVLVCEERHSQPIAALSVNHGRLQEIA